MAVRTIRDGSLAITDGTTPTANSVTATFDGEVSWREVRNYTLMRDRGVANHLRKGDDEIVEVTFTIKVDSLSGGPSVYDALTQKGGASAWASVDGTTDVYYTQIVLTIADPGTGTDDETVTFAKCAAPTNIQFTEAMDGNMLSFTLLDMETAPTIA